jgi:hypothetical protein
MKGFNAAKRQREAASRSGNRNGNLKRQKAKKLFRYAFT